MPSVSVIEAKYKRAKLIVSNTILYSQLNQNEKAEIENRLNRLPDEEYVIYYSNNSLHYSWVITTKRIIVMKNDEIEYYSYNSIVKIELEDLIKGRTDKISNNTLKLVFDNGKSDVIYVENSSWHFVYTLLKFLVP